MQGGKIQSQKINHYDVESLKNVHIDKVLKEVDLTSKYINDLLDEVKSRVAKTHNELNDGLPNEKRAITFKIIKTSEWIKGVYIASEQMFYVGFEESGDFYYHSEVSNWKYCNDDKLDALAKDIHNPK